jgi:hypothetical protein
VKSTRRENYVSLIAASYWVKTYRTEAIKVKALQYQLHLEAGPFLAFVDQYQLHLGGGQEGDSRARLRPGDQPRIRFGTPVLIGKNSTEYGEKQNYRRMRYHFEF